MSRPIYIVQTEQADGHYVFTSEQDARDFARIRDMGEPVLEEVLFTRRMALSIISEARRAAREDAS
jgi:hypothetical protein